MKLKEKMETKIICLHQLLTPFDFEYKEGHGNCKYCIPNENNKNCSGYYPINLEIAKVKIDERTLEVTVVIE